MLTPLTFALLALTVVATSFLSGIFGMAGGIILLGVLLVVLDVAPAMVLFGTTQMAANGWRAILWRAHVQWRLIGGYVVGACVAFVCMRFIAWVPPKSFMYIALGSSPFIANALPKSLEPDITRPAMPFIGGAALTVINLLAGATGTLLDVLFQKSKLDRISIVATKAVTQTFAHLLRIFYFGSVATAADSVVPWWAYPCAIGLAMVGTTLASSVLRAMSNEDFRKWSRVHEPLVSRRVVRHHPQHHHARAVAFAEHARALRDILGPLDGAGGLDAGADRHLLQIDAAIGVAFLVAGLAVVAVVDAQNLEVGRVEDGDGCERSDIHEQLAIPGRYQDLLVGSRQRQPEPHRYGGSHGACHAVKIASVVGQGCHVLGRTGEAGHDEEVVRISNQLRHDFTPVEDICWLAAGGT
jgi:uncharacterized membrane protein YfcA